MFALALLAHTIKKLVTLRAFNMATETLDESAVIAQCKNIGLRGLAHMSEMTEQDAHKLRRWSKDRPRLFQIVLFGCQKVLESQRNEERAES